MNYAFFGLDNPPFDQTPGIEYFVATEAIQNVWLCLGDRILTDHRVVVLVGKAGTGKTMLSNFLLEKLYTHAPVTKIVVQQPTPLKLLSTMCADLEIGNFKDLNNNGTLAQRLSDSINAHRARDAKIVILLDDAQDIEPETFRLLKDVLEIDQGENKTLQLILVGQPEVLTHLQDQDLSEYIENLSTPCLLQPFSKMETRAYIAHRLEVGGGRPSTFNVAARGAVHRLSGGIPRTINVICDNALQVGWQRSEPVISASVVRAAAQGVLACQEGGRRREPLFDSLMSKVEHLGDRFIQALEAPFGSWKPTISEAAKALEDPSGNLIVDAAPAFLPNNDALSNDAALVGLTEERARKEKIDRDIEIPASAAERQASEWLAPCSGPKWSKEKASGLIAASEFQALIEQQSGPANAQPPMQNGTRTAISSDRKKSSKMSRIATPPGMVYIPDMRLHSVYSGKMIEVAGFCLDCTPVTNRAYSQFVENTGYPPPDYWCSVKPPKKLLDYPVVSISLDVARRFAEWSGKRLPTWCEWEASVRRPDNRSFPWGDHWESDRCNDPTSGLGKLMPVEAFPNGSSMDGCLDLLGNVWEWTELAEEGAQLEQGYAWVVGGSFRHPCIVNGAVARSQVLKVNKYTYLGFRCAANRL